MRPDAGQRAPTCGAHLGEELVHGPGILVDVEALVQRLVLLVAVLLLADLRDDQVRLQLADLLRRLLEAVLAVAVCSKSRRTLALGVGRRAGSGDAHTSIACRI